MRRSTGLFPSGQALVDEVDRPVELFSGGDEGWDDAEHVPIGPAVDDDELPVEGVGRDMLEGLGIGNPGPTVLYELQTRPGAPA